MKIKIMLYFSLFIFESSHSLQASSLFNKLSKKKYMVLFVLTFSMPTIYLLEKRIVTHYIKKYSILPRYRTYRYFPTSLFFNFNLPKNCVFGTIPRPPMYEYHAILKVEKIKNCFYSLKENKENQDSFYYNKDFTQSVVGESQNKNEEDYKKIAIAKLLSENKNSNEKKLEISADSENPLATMTLTLYDATLLQGEEKQAYTQLFTGKNGERLHARVDLDMSDPERFLPKDVLPDHIKNKMEALLKVSADNLIDGRLFEKKIPYQKVKTFIDVIFSKEDKNFENAKYIYNLLEGTMLFSKKTDMDVVLKFFSIFDPSHSHKDRQSCITALRNDPNFENLKKILAMDLLYGIFPDTCNGLLRNLCSSKSLIEGLRKPANTTCDTCTCLVEEADYFSCGPVTILEGLYFLLKKRIELIRDSLLKQQDSDEESLATRRKELKEKLEKEERLFSFLN